MTATRKAGRTRATRKRLTIPYTPTEWESIDAEAKRQGLTKTEFVRRAGLAVVMAAENARAWMASNKYVEPSD